MPATSEKREFRPPKIACRQDHKSEQGTQQIQGRVRVESKLIHECEHEIPHDKENPERASEAAGAREGAEGAGSERPGEHTAIRDTAAHAKDIRREGKGTTGRDEQLLLII